MIKAFTDKVLLEEKRDVLRVHLYFKLIQYGIRPFENDIDIIIELYMFGGYSNAEEQIRFMDICLKKKLRKSIQSLRNVLSKYVTLGIFEKPKNTILQLNDRFIPKVECEKLVLQYTISHAK
jgi:hypothetical protein